MNNLSNLQSVKTHKPSRRIGRGLGSTKGRTSTRGHKGYKARTGSTSRLRYEGGQNPIVSRIPKLKGFKKLIREHYKVLNVSELVGLAEKGILNKKILVKLKLLQKGYKLKILGDGEIKEALKIEADGFSGSAKEKIEKAGGEVIVVVGKKKEEKK